MAPHSARFCYDCQNASRNSSGRLGLSYLRKVALRVADLGDGDLEVSVEAAGAAIGDATFGGDLVGNALGVGGANKGEGNSCVLHLENADNDDEPKRCDARTDGRRKPRTEYDEQTVNKEAFANARNDSDVLLLSKRRTHRDKRRLIGGGTRTKSGLSATAGVGMLWIYSEWKEDSFFSRQPKKRLLTDFFLFSRYCTAIAMDGHGKEKRREEWEGRGRFKVAEYIPYVFSVSMLELVVGGGAIRSEPSAIN